jgi:hypothetical protein
VVEPRRQVGPDQIGDFGPMTMPLDEALDYTARDPMDIFWH